ncbi:MAG: hypothetical protein HY288_12335 [Planctomycetia bacterium]|nr:hypothetical protein [Planctomycetia bacterium]
MSGRRSTLGRGGTSGRGSASGRSSTSGRGGAVGFERSGSSARGNNTFHSFGIKNYITSNGKQLPGYQRTTEDPIQKIDYGIQKADYGGNYKTDYRGDPRSDYRHDYSDPNIVNPYIDETGAFAPKKK